MKRRDFLTTAAVTTGYSMFIKVDGLAQDQDKRTAEQIRQEMQRIVPTGNRTAAPLERNMTLVDLQCDVLVAGADSLAVWPRLAPRDTARKSSLCRIVRALAAIHRAKSKCTSSAPIITKGVPAGAKAACWKKSG